ncbi:MAG TPA: PaaI family thioesterase [Candidatus Deferrimicrobiaceae bacterium]|nr:PaaI family thioesterase [Candidatus Deferrimicrobiaceae bacterium]
MTLRQISDSSTRDSLTRDSLTKVPFNALLGMRLHRVHRDGITVACTLRDDLQNSAGVAHGGVAATMADAAVGGAIQHHFGGGRRITTVELKINYFLPVTEGRIFARSHLLRVGSTLCVGSVDLSNENGRAIGTAIVTYMILDAPAVQASDLRRQSSARVPNAPRAPRPSRRK